MFRLDDILEKWAVIYRPLSHELGDKGNRKTFFRISMIDAQSYFVRNYSMQPSPAMAYATHVDADMDKGSKRITYRHVIYFLVKQLNGSNKTNVTDERAATEARYTTDEMVQDLIDFLDEMKRAACSNKQEYVAPNGVKFRFDRLTQQGFRGLQLDEVHWGTLPTMLNGWQICGVSIDQIVPRHLCVNESKYIAGDDNNQNQNT